MASLAYREKNTIMLMMTESMKKIHIVGIAAYRCRIVRVMGLTAGTFITKLYLCKKVNC